MSTTTTNLNLKKPDSTDFINIDDINDNMDLIDAAVNERAKKSEIPVIPSSLPAAGGNADTVDNKHASDFASSTHTHTKADIGLGNVDNTSDANKSVNYAATAGSATNATNATNANYANGAGNADTVDGWHMNLTVDGWGIKPISAGTVDLIEGVSDLPQGHIYIVYE